MTSKGCVAAEFRWRYRRFQDAQLENQTSDGFRIGGILLVQNSY